MHAFLALFAGRAMGMMGIFARFCLFTRLTKLAQACFFFFCSVMCLSHACSSTRKQIVEPNSVWLIDWLMGGWMNLLSNRSLRPFMWEERKLTPCIDYWSCCKIDAGDGTFVGKHNLPSHIPDCVSPSSSWKWQSFHARPLMMIMKFSISMHVRKGESPVDDNDFMKNHLEVMEEWVLEKSVFH